MRPGFSKLLVIIGILILCGCASGPNNIETVHVDKAKYSELSCKELKREMDSTLAQITELHNSLTNAAGDDSTQLTIATFMLLPYVFLLEGGNGKDGEKYARLKGEAIALRNTAFDKNCDFTHPKKGE